MRILLYLLAIVTANVVTASFAPMEFGLFIVPYGTLFIGFTFILRDLVQNKYGRKLTYGIIGVALLLSALTSYMLGDSLMIVMASALSFLFAETADTEIYTRLEKPMHIRVLYSGLVGGLLDSAIFVVVGLSPIGAGFLPWDLVIYAIIGQVVVKSVLQFAGAFILRKVTK